MIMYVIQKMIFFSISSIKDNTMHRIKCNYSKDELDIIKLDKKIILLQINKLEKEKKIILYENQKYVAQEIVTQLQNKRIINIMIIAKTQSGKTGCMCATIKFYLEQQNNIIPINNIYIITGLNSCEWKYQTKERIPKEIQNRVYHGSELSHKFIDEIKNKKNILILIDEIQIAAKKGQIIHNIFKKANLYDIKKLYTNDIKILEYTATPDGTIYDLMNWKESSTKILMNPGKGYMSSYMLLQLGRVKQYKDLCGHKIQNNKLMVINNEYFKNLQELKKEIDSFKSFRYHIIRTPVATLQDIMIKNFKKIFDISKYDYKMYDRKSDIHDINEILKEQPEYHILNKCL